MKWWSSYLKEMKIAGRGFYFYIEIFIAVIMVVILLFFVKEHPQSNEKQLMYYDMTPFMFNIMTNRGISDGSLRMGQQKKFMLNPSEFQVINDQTGSSEQLIYNDKKQITVKILENIDPETGDLLKTVYVTDNKEDMIRLAFQERQLGAVVKMNEKGQFSYEYYLQGYETERLVNLLYVIHDEKSTLLQTQMDHQQIRELESGATLNSRENILPIFITFAGSLMGFFIVMAYIFLDKDEGVIKAFAVTPSSISTYLLSKTGVILTTVLISTSIVTIPVMGAKANYTLLYIFLLVTTFAFSQLGLLISTFYDAFDKAFGMLYLVMVILMVPAFSYLIPGFDPVFLRVFPTYPVLMGFKDILLNVSHTGYVWIYSLVFLLAGIILLWVTQKRLSKTLTV